jgi:hypothetical protein
MKRKDAPQDLRNKSLLLSASIIDMVHGTKQKWITTCKGNPFIGKHTKNSLLYAKRKVVENLNMLSIKKML